jgi:hypothetical protein
MEDEVNRMRLCRTLRKAMEPATPSPSGRASEDGSQTAILILACQGFEVAN